VKCGTRYQALGSSGSSCRFSLTSCATSIACCYRYGDMGRAGHVRRCSSSAWRTSRTAGTRRVRALRPPPANTGGRLWPAFSCFPPRVIFTRGTCYRRHRGVKRFAYLLSISPLRKLFMGGPERGIPISGGHARHRDGVGEPAVFVGIPSYPHLSRRHLPPLRGRRFMVTCGGAIVAPRCCRLCFMVRATRPRDVLPNRAAGTTRQIFACRVTNNVGVRKRGAATRPS